MALMSASAASLRGGPRRTSPRPGTGSSLTRGHLWQVDVVRLLTFGAVIAVHSLAFTQQPANVPAAGAMMLLQYGREVFFSLTGFVLIYSTAGRPLRLGKFWRKRITYVVVPYVIWSAIYYGYSIWGPTHATFSVGTFATDLLYGGAEYHLYFLLVTVQLYLFFPLIRRFVYRTADRAVPVLLAVAAANLAWLAVLQYMAYPSSGAGLWFLQHAYELLPTYSMYVLGGCYAAVHLGRVQQFVETRGRLLFGVAVASALLAVAVYTLQLPFMAPRSANSVTQPGMTFSCIAAVIAVYVIGCRWAAGRRRHQALIETLSDASFGVYLSHPFVLQMLLDYGGFANGHQVMPSALCTVLAFVISVTGGTLISVAFRRTPLSLALTGRPWRTEVKRQPASTPGRAVMDLGPALATTERRAAC